jgi:hypothetical protein
VKTALLLLLMLVSLFCALTPVVAQPPPRANPTQIKADLDSIFSRPEFRVETAKSDNIFTRVWKWIVDQWNAFWKRVRDALGSSGVRLGGGGGLQWVFIVAFLVFMAWLLAKLLRGFIGYRSERKAGKRTVFDFDEADADVIVEPDVWLQQAERFAQEGDFRRAFRAVFIAVILQLDRAGAIRFDRARTNGDYLRQLRGGDLPDALRLFGPLTVEFDQRWYGDHPTAEADYRRCRETHTALLNMISAASARADGKTPAPAGGSA